MNTQHFAIGVLTITAAVLLVGLLMLNQVPQAQAIGQTGAGGDYLVATGQLRGSTEAVYVLDSEVNRIVAYVLDPQAERLVRLDGIDLNELPSKSPPGRDRTQRGRR